MNNGSPGFEPRAGKKHLNYAPCHSTREHQVCVL